MDSLDVKTAADESKPDAAEPESSPEVDVSSPDDSERLPSDQTEGSNTPKRQDKQGYKKQRKLYQALARIEGSLQVKDDDIVLITKGDQAELKVLQIVGKHTAMRLLKRPDNRRQGIYSLYPQVQGVKIINFVVEQEGKHPTVPPADQMFISGKFVSQEEDAFLVDIGRNKRTHKAKKQVEIPLKIEGQAADPSWTVGQWIGLVMHRQGAKWLWQGDTRAVLRSSGNVEVKKEH